MTFTVVTIGFSSLRWLAPFAVLVMVLQMWPLLPIPARHRESVPGLYLHERDRDPINVTAD